MKRKNKGLTLIEVLITVAVLATAIVFVFRGFVSSLSATRFSQNITLACLVAEDRIWRLENKLPLTDSAEVEERQDSKFLWEDAIGDVNPDNLPGLKLLTLTASWEEKRKNLYSLVFLTYFYQPENPQ